MWDYYWYVYMSVYFYICHFLCLHVFLWVCLDPYSRMCCYLSCFCPLGELDCELVEQIAGQCLSCQSPCSAEEILSPSLFSLSVYLSQSVCVCESVYLCEGNTSDTTQTHWLMALFSIPQIHSEELNAPQPQADRKCNDQTRAHIFLTSVLLIRHQRFIIQQ